MYIFICCLFLNTEKDSIPIFFYLSSQDTIHIFSSDILDKTESKTNTVFQLSDDAVRRVSTINDMNGRFYYYLENDKIWVYVQPIDYYAEYIPYGYHLLTYNGTFLIENHYINIGFRLPTGMFNSKGHIRHRYRRMLKRPTIDSQYVRIINRIYSKCQKKQLNSSKRKIQQNLF